MDVIAHGVAGALLGRSIAPRGEDAGYIATFCAIAALSPDIDFPLALLGHDVWYHHHQLYTHSLLGLLWVPALLAALSKRLSFRRAYPLALVGWGLHVVMDVCARWPVPVPWPLSDARWCWRLIAADFSWIVDMILLVGLLLTLWDPARPHARWIAIGTGIFAGGWMLAGLPT